MIAFDAIGCTAAGALLLSYVLLAVGKIVTVSWTYTLVNRRSSGGCARSAADRRRFVMPVSTKRATVKHPSMNSAGNTPAANT